MEVNVLAILSGLEFLVAADNVTSVILDVSGVLDASALKGVESSRSHGAPIRLCLISSNGSTHEDLVLASFWPTFSEM